MLDLLRTFSIPSIMTIRIFFLAYSSWLTSKCSISSSSAICLNGTGEWGVKLETTRSPLVYKHLISWNSPFIPQNRKLTFAGKKPWEGRVQGFALTMSHTPEVTREGTACHSGKSTALTVGSPGFREGFSTISWLNMEPITSPLWLRVSTTKMSGWQVPSTSVPC